MGDEGGPLANARVDMYIEGDTIQFHLRANIRIPVGGSDVLVNHTGEQASDLGPSAEPIAEGGPAHQLEDETAINDQKQIVVKIEYGEEAEPGAFLHNDMEEDMEVDQILALTVWEQETRVEDEKEFGVHSSVCLTHNKPIE
jgi:hypothetical protein